MIGIYKWVTLMSIKRILSFTGIRSDYDLMSELYQKINEQQDMEIKLIVSGAHLSDTYGYTYSCIKDDNIPVLATIESLIDSNSKASRIKSMSILLQSCIHSVESYNPDLIMYAGDREDVMVGALIGAYLNIPTAHFFGGDHASDGNVDNTIRHATSKLSSFHFVTNETSAERLLKMGEVKDRIYNVGSPAIDKFISTPFIKKEELLTKFHKNYWEDYAVLIYHPIMGEEQMASEYFKEILIALDKEKINTFVGYPNIDSGNREIIKIINEFKHKKHISVYKNLRRNDFINLLRDASFLIGNSSAGLYEAPSIPLGVVNVGNRQKGRLATDNVIFVNQGVDNIRKGIREVTSDYFRSELSKVKSPFGNGNSSDKVINILNSIDSEHYSSKCEDPLGED